LPFQDKRNDTGHVENVTYFALRLLEHFPEVKRDIVMPAAILHDTGWSQLTDTERALFYETGDDGTGTQICIRYDPILRARHQEQGVYMAGRILTDLGYSQEHTPHILEIISEHDTRNGFISAEDGIMRDADKLWRYTYPHILLGIRERGDIPEKLRDLLIDNCKKEGFFYSDIAREIAMIELEHSMDEYKRQNG